MEKGESGREALEARIKAQYLLSRCRSLCAPKWTRTMENPCQGDLCVVVQPAVIGRKMALAASYRRLVCLLLLVARRTCTSTWTLGDCGEGTRQHSVATSLDTRCMSTRSRRVVVYPGCPRSEEWREEEDREGQFSETDDCQSEARSSDDGALTADDLRVFVESSENVGNAGGKLKERRRGYCVLLSGAAVPRRVHGLWRRGLTLASSWSLLSWSMMGPTTP